MDFFVEAFISTMNGWSPELLWVIMLFICFLSILGINRFFGPFGLYVYIGIAIIGANIQVLKAVQFGLYPEPVALGTILFSTTYLVTDIIGEQFGAKAARRGVYLGFIAHLLFSILMIITIGFAPLTIEQAGENMAWALPYHGNIASLFTPQITLFLAGMAAYFTSQLHDVWLYNLLKRKTNDRFLWLRNNASTMLSALIDNTIFSILAWIVFSSNPLPFATVVFTYILGTYWLRLIIAVLDTPIIYIANRWRYKGSLND